MFPLLFGSFFYFLSIITPVLGEEKAPGIQNGQCLPIATTIELMKTTFKEQVIFTGTSHRDEQIIITHNPLNKSWTALSSYAGNFLCIMDYGSQGKTFNSVLLKAKQ